MSREITKLIKIRQDSLPVNGEGLSCRTEP